MSQANGAERYECFLGNASRAISIFDAACPLFRVLRYVPPLESRGQRPQSSLASRFTAGAFGDLMSQTDLSEPAARIGGNLTMTRVRHGTCSKLQN